MNTDLNSLFNQLSSTKPSASRELRSTNPVAWSDDQLVALNRFDEFLHTDKPVLVLSGPAGTGKTTVLREILSRADRHVHLCATTHKAARVAISLTGRPAGTIHSLLGLRPKPDNVGGFKLSQEGEIKVVRGSLVVIDESSMIDSALLRFVGGAIRAYDVKILFVGDAFQLPPVGEETSPVFSKIPEKHQVHLTTVHRQSAGNPILDAATTVRAVLTGGGWRSLDDMTATVEERGLEQRTRFEFEEQAIARVVEAYRAEDFDRTKILAWTNKRVIAFNDRIRRELYGPDAPTYMNGERLVANSAIAQGGEIVVMNETEIVVSREPHNVEKYGIRGYDLVVSAPDTGLVKVFVPASREEFTLALNGLRAEALTLQKRFDKKRDNLKLDHDRRAAWRAFYSFKESCADLRPPFASTVHKSQGSTYDEVFVDVGDIGKSREDDLIARLLYVAFTRARYNVYTTGGLPARLFNN